MKAYRASILRFDPDQVPSQSALFEKDGLLVVGGFKSEVQPMDYAVVAAP